MIPIEFVFGHTLNKKVAMATKNGLSIIFQFQNLAYTYLRKFTKFEGGNNCRFIVPPIIQCPQKIKPIGLGKRTASGGSLL